MANQIIIDIGAVANDGTGDPLRTAFGYVNDNFSNVWATGVANSNIAFSGNKILTTNTNGNLVLAPNGTGKVQANVDIIPNANNTISLGATDKRWNTVYTRNLDVDGNVTFAGNITISSDLVVDGNLTVNGTTTSINTANLDVEDKVITIAYGSPNATVANGSGITVAGANANIIWSNTLGWTFNTAVSTTGNITAPYFIGNGSQLTGITSYSNANVSAYLASGTDTANIITTGNISAGNIIGTFVAPGFNQDIVFNRSGMLSTASGFNYNYAGNILYAPAAGFSGDLDTGTNGLFVGHGTFTVLGSDILGQFTGNVNAYSQINSQNTSNGSAASGDYVITADNGTDVTHFINMGITSSTWDGSQTNSLGNRLGPNDGYLYVQDGDLVVGTNNGSIYTWKFDQAGNLTVPGNIIPAGNNTQNLGSASYQWNDLYLSNATIYMNSVPISLTAGNVLTVNGEAVLTNDSNTTITTTGNITANYFLGNIEGLNGNISGLTSTNFDVVNISARDSSGVNIGAGGFNNLVVLPDEVLIQNVPLTVAGNILSTVAGGLNITANTVANGVAQTWNFGTDGRLTFPGTPRIATDSDNFEVQAAESINFEANAVVNIYTDTSGTTYQWQFDDTGNLNLPNNGSINFAAGGIVQAVDEDFSIRVQDADDDGFALIQQVDDGSGNVLGSTELQRDLFTIAFAGGSAPQFRFNEAGQTEIPGNIRATEYVDTSLYSVSNDDGAGTVELKVISYAADTLGSNIRVAQSNATISTGNAQYTWKFDNVGNLTLPGNTFTVNYANGTPVSLGGTYSNSNVANFMAAFGSNTISTTGNITAGNITTDWLNIGNVGNIARLEADVLLQITTNATSNTAPSWTFNTDGTLFVPGNIAGDNNGPLIIDGNGSGIEGYISLPASNFGGEQITIVNEFTLGNGISLVTNGGEWHFGNSGAFTAPGNITTTANISGGYILGNAAFMTGIPASYGNANVADFLDSLGSNAIVTTGNISGGNLLASGYANITGNINGSGATFSGNVTAANFSGNISITGNVTGTSPNVSLVAGSYTYTFDNTGVLSLPAVGGDEGGEIHLGIPTANTTLQDSVKIDVYQDRLRFFEGSANAKGAYLDLANCPSSVSAAIGYRDIPQISFSANATATGNAAGCHYYSTTAGNLALTLPDNSNVAFPTGATLTVVMNAAGNVIVAQGTGVTLYMAGSSTTGNRTVGAYGLASVMKVAANTWVISGTGVY